MDMRYAYWVCQIGGWSLYSAIILIVFTANDGFSWEMATYVAVFAVLGIGITHIFRRYIKRWEWLNLSLRPLIPRVLLGVLVLATASHIVTYVTGRFILEIEAFQAVDSEITATFAQIFQFSIIYLLWSGLYFGTHYFWSFRSAEIEKWKLKAEIEATRLKALELQLNPHFFFNSLNSVRALIAENPSRAQRMVTKLSSLLRYTLQADDETVSLRKELDIARDYFELEKMRLEERLQYELDVDEATLEQPVPYLVVQTLAENAIKHGIAPRADGGFVTVESEATGNGTRLRVTNTGQIERSDVESGVGLQNARERLQLIFGEEAYLHLENSSPDTVTADVFIPEAPKERSIGDEDAPFSASDEAVSEPALSHE